MSALDLVEKGLLSIKAYNHIMGIESIDFDYYKQPDSIYRLKTHFFPPTHRITIDGYILALTKPKYIHNSDLYLFKFLIGDETDNIWVCLWIKDTSYPYHLLSFPSGSRDPKKRSMINISNASLITNEYYNSVELSINSWDNLSFV